MTDPSFLDDVIKGTCDEVRKIVEGGMGSVRVSVFKDGNQRGAMISYEQKKRILEKKNVDERGSK